jgi:hypothetical protein
MNKHEKIYELTGIEPLWWNDDEKLTPNKFVQEELLNTRWFKEVAKPHYPCEQLWGTLPEVFVSLKNLQEALLDMVLWAIEQGHIPKKRDEE